MDRARFAREQLLMLRRRLDTGKQFVARADLWQIRSEANADVYDGHFCIACRLKHACSPADKFFLGLRIDRHDAGLAVHCKESSARGVQGEVSCHCAVTLLRL